MKQKLLIGLITYFVVLGVLLGVRDVDSIGRILLLGGLLVTVVAQIVGLFLCKAKSSAEAFLILTVPGYFLLSLWRAGNYLTFLVVYMIGIGSIVAGTLLLNRSWGLPS